MRNDLLSLALLAIPTTAGASLTNDDVEVVVNAAFKLLDAGLFEQASQKIEPIIARYESENWPKDQRVYCGHSAPETLLYMTSGAVADANSIDIGAPYCDALFLRAYLQTEANDGDEALATLARLRELAPENAQYIVELAHVLKMRGRLDEALTLYRSVPGKAALAPTDALEKRWNAVALRGIGYILIEQRKWAEGEQAYRDSQKFDPDSEIARNELDFIKKNRTD